MENLNDRQLLKRCQTYGRRSLKWRWKFLGLLPEVDRRRLWEDRGFSSIFHFAAQTAGVSREQVRRVLNMDKRFAERGVFRLREMLIEGEVSPNKLARVVSVATDDNETILVEQVRLLPHRAVERAVKDIRYTEQNGFPQPKIEAKSVHVHAVDGGGDCVSGLPLAPDEGRDCVGSLSLAPDVAEALSKIPEVNQFLRQALADRRERIEREKADIAANLPKRQSRYIPVRVRRVLLEEYGEKCAVRTCAWMADEIHHVIPFSLNPVHDPNLMAPLCREHHSITHAVNDCVQERRKEAVGAGKTVDKLKI